MAKNYSQHCQSMGRDMNAGPTEYKAGLLTILAQSSRFSLLIQNILPLHLNCHWHQTQTWERTFPKWNLSWPVLKAWNSILIWRGGGGVQNDSDIMTVAYWCLDCDVLWKLRSNPTPSKSFWLIREYSDWLRYVMIYWLCEHTRSQTTRLNSALIINLSHANPTWQMNLTTL
jgi:hypothetical protein